MHSVASSRFIDPCSGSWLPAHAVAADLWTGCSALSSPRLPPDVGLSITSGRRRRVDSTSHVLDRNERHPGLEVVRLEVVPGPYVANLNGALNSGAENHVLDRHERHSGLEVDRHSGLAVW